MEETTKDQVKLVFKSDMKTAEEMNNLVENFDNSEIGQTSVEVVKEMVEKIEDPIRIKCLFATCYQIGKSVGDEELAKFAANNLQKWENDHGR